MAIAPIAGLGRGDGCGWLLAMDAAGMPVLSTRHGIAAAPPLAKQGVVASLHAAASKAGIKLRAVVSQRCSANELQEGGTQAPTSASALLCYRPLPQLSTGDAAGVACLLVASCDAQLPAAQSPAGASFVSPPFRRVPTSPLDAVAALVQAADEARAADGAVGGAVGGVATVCGTPGAVATAPDAPEVSRAARTTLASSTRADVRTTSPPAHVAMAPGATTLRSSSVNAAVSLEHPTHSGAGSAARSAVHSGLLSKPGVSASTATALPSSAYGNGARAFHDPLGGRTWRWLIPQLSVCDATLQRAIAALSQWMGVSVMESMLVSNNRRQFRTQLAGIAPAIAAMVADAVCGTAPALPRRVDAASIISRVCSPAAPGWPTVALAVPAVYLPRPLCAAWMRFMFAAAHACHATHACIVTGGRHPIVATASWWGLDVTTAATLLCIASCSNADGPAGLGSPLFSPQASAGGLASPSSPAIRPTTMVRRVHLLPASPGDTASASVPFSLITLPLGVSAGAVPAVTAAGHSDAGLGAGLEVSVGTGFTGGVSLVCLVPQRTGASGAAGSDVTPQRITAQVQRALATGMLGSTWAVDMILPLLAAQTAGMCLIPATASGATGTTAGAGGWGAEAASPDLVPLVIRDGPTWQRVCEVKSADGALAKWTPSASAIGGSGVASGPSGYAWVSSEAADGWAAVRQAAWGRWERGVWG